VAEPRPDPRGGRVLLLRPDRSRLACFLALPLLLAFPTLPRPAHALGPGTLGSFHEHADWDRLANQRFLLTGMRVTEGPEVDGILSSLRVSYQGTRWISGSFEIPFVSIENRGAQDYDWGDLKIRLLARARSGADSTTTALLSMALRFPTGDPDLYPFATSAFDFELAARVYLRLGPVLLSPAAGYVTRSTLDEDVAFAGRLRSRVDGGLSLEWDWERRGVTTTGAYGSWFGEGKSRTTLHASHRIPFLGRTLLRAGVSVQLGDDESILYDVSGAIGVAFLFP
jgi:hypothetical protein